MNKQDIKLIFIVLAFASIIFSVFKINENNSNLNAFVYYDNDLVLTIDLSQDEKSYEVEGYNGIVKIIAGNGRVKVDSEKSPLHLCSKQGYINKSYESIICLPNKIVVKIDGSNELDALVK